MDGGKFFGAFRACSGIKDAVTLTHVPVGCNWGAAMFKTTSNQPDIRQACTVMHEREIVFGGEEALREALVRADKLYNTPLLAVVAGDAPAIIGDDVEAVIDSVALNKEVVWIDAAGFKGTMREGYEEALVHLARLMEERNVIKKSVNLIGFCPDDFKVDADIKEITRLLNSAGIQVNCVISNCSFKEFVNAPAAELNVVMGQGAELAEHMKKAFGVPYLEVDYPYGLEGTKEFINTICEHLRVENKEKDFDLEPFKRIYLYLHELYGTPVSVIGDCHAEHMAGFLDSELGFDIEVLADNEDDYFIFQQNVRDSNTTILFGSSFERNIADELRIPLVRFIYPVFDHVCVYEDAPYAGFRGAVCLTETILNAVMGFGDKFEAKTKTGGEIIK
jgi:nitrogenase molybdenum-iron protein beta chain